MIIKLATFLSIQTVEELKSCSYKGSRVIIPFLAYVALPDVDILNPRTQKNDCMEKFRTLMYEPALASKALNTLFI